MLNTVRRDLFILVMSQPLFIKIYHKFISLVTGGGGSNQMQTTGIIVGLLVVLIIVAVIVAVFVYRNRRYVLSTISKIEITVLRIEY